MSKKRHRPPGKKRRLTENDKLFALEYLKNGRNATQAWRTLHPKASDKSAATLGYEALRKVEIADFITARTREQMASAIMEADEALAIITRHARGDPRKLFKDGKLLPIAQWPDDVADCVKALKPGVKGTAITFYDKLDAAKTMAINGGKLRAGVEHTHRFPHLELLGSEPPEGDDE